jgi:hypothetical protein
LDWGQIGFQGSGEIASALWLSSYHRVVINGYLATDLGSGVNYDVVSNPASLANAGVGHDGDVVADIDSSGELN